MTGGECLVGDALGDGWVRGHLTSDSVCRCDAFEHRQSLRERLVDEVVAVDVKDVEEPWGEDLLAGGIGAEAAHRVLERPW